MSEAGLKLRTAVPGGDWRSFVMTAISPGVAAGQMDLIGATVGVFAQLAETGEKVAFIYHAEKISVPKVVTTAYGIFTAGDKVYFDHAAGKVTKATSGTYCCGICVKDAGVAETSVLIDLDGAHVTAS